MKALEYMKEFNIDDNDIQIEERSIEIFTDSKITLDSLRNGHNHNYLIEIRKNL